MYLSKLRIYGFKSFANKVEVNFPKDGITSIVGPNGCGKSNIVDAIRWVLGEQKVKQLRSSKMEDVIFSGTEKLPPMNMAEVSLIIQNDKGTLPGGHTHVMITRQVYRSGDSGYLINNQPCRLKDIQHLFYDTGMGAASYSLMEARMIDSVLSDKDEERRVLFEEACGISKYKKQRAETLRQLERTSIDLDRVEDNLRHTKQSVSMFERQAKKAESWKQISDQIKNTEISFRYDEYRDIQSQYQENSRSRDQYRRRAEEIEGARAEQEAILSTKKLEVVDDERQLAESNQLVANTQAQGVQLTNDIQRAKDRIHHLEESLLKQKENKDETVKRIAGYIEEKHRLEERLMECKGQLEQIQLTFDASEVKKEQLQDIYETKREEAEELSSQRITFLEEFNQWKDKLGRNQAEKELLERQIKELEESIQRESSESQNINTEYDPLKIELEKEVGILSEVSQKLESAESKYQELKKDLEEKRASFRALENEKVALETQRKVLQNMHDSMDGVSQGTQHIVKTFSEQVDSVFADKMDVPEQYADVVETCIGESLQSLVVKSPNQIKEMLGDLQDNEKGRAIFIKNGSSFKRERKDLSGRPGFKTWLIDNITVPDNLKPTLEYLIGNFVLVENFETAEKWAEEFTQEDLWMVTPEGFVVHTSGLIQGGHQAGEEQGLLQKKNKLEKITADLHRVISSYEELESTLENYTSEFTELERDLDSLRIEKSALEARVGDHKANLSIMDSKMEGYLERNKQAENKLSELSIHLGKVQEQYEELDREVGEKEELKLSLDERNEESQIALRRAEEDRQDHETEFLGNQQKLQELKAEIDRIQQKQSHLEDSEKEHSSIQLKLDLEEQEWGTSITENKTKIEELNQKLHVVNEKLAEESEARDKVKAVYDEKVLGMEEHRTAINEFNKEFHDNSKLQHELDIKIEHNSSYMRNMEERMYELYEVDFESGEFEYENTEYNADTVESELKELKEKLKRIGNVNTGALEDYEQEKLHLEEVQKQFDDLENAKLGLERAIRKLDKLAREQFLETFEKIRKNFQDIFTTLFQGGQAQLQLEEEVDPLEAKIIINASPAGKKMKGVTLLSGGERALTAISMLFSLYLVRVSPYCVMDEVDGPLDDANIGRFVALLRRFSSQTQFLVVTHNKRTMAASDMLYGVTQEIKGISQLSSVKLDEASLMAA